ncbi:uncharacterized protein LODBEIA_P15250 [Lodderomyces beijingensis]|uniref:Cytidyltransferase-like domain-containing protein n=1 Tax=Lodderomyces beijingensis TaxID=1775926 RepID=A0ABP0ZGK7_9ASCO
MSRFNKTLQEFISSKSDFSVIYSASKHHHHSQGRLITPTTQRVCVLDSSFNPPHLGHYTLVEESLKSNYDNTPMANKSILLLLSTQNADKSTNHLSGEMYSHRLDMIHLMADDLAARFPQVDIAIGLTKHAKFVDKSLSIIEYIDADAILNSAAEGLPIVKHPNFKLTFLIGFDTLIRILNPKYYLPDKLSLSLEHFMKMTDLFCLTRQVDSTTIAKQEDYISEISSGVHEDIPSHWSKNIFLVTNLNRAVADISSSSIRRQIGGARSHDDDDDDDENDNEDRAVLHPRWKNQVIPSVASYIENHHLYESN